MKAIYATLLCRRVVSFQRFIGESIICQFSYRLGILSIRICQMHILYIIVSNIVTFREIPCQCTVKCLASYFSNTDDGISVYSTPDI